LELFTNIQSWITQYAWDDIDKYYTVASNYKFVRKLSCIALLVLSDAVTILSILDGEGYELRTAIITLGFVTTPPVCWQRLFVAELSIVNQAYKFP
jgi:hypothetical protein